MAVVRALNNRRAPMALSDSALKELRESLRGKLITPGEPGYDDARRVWNRLIDKRPCLIARCVSASDVISCVNFARSNDMLVSVRGGGHHIAGYAVCDDGLTIDLSSMKSIQVDPQQRTARSDPGVTWGEFDHETQAFGLGVTGGVVSTTGIAGLTLGGGIGWLGCKYGLSCDNLISVDIVTADGVLKRASESDNADLFWAVRGGGGNYGVVTSFQFQLHPVGPTVLAGAVVHPFSKAKEVLKFYREYCARAPNEVTTMASCRTSPQGDRVISIGVCYCGPLGQGEKALEPLRKFGTPLADLVKPMSYRSLQALGETRYPDGFYRYWKDSLMDSLSDAAIEVLVEGVSHLSSPYSSVALAQLGGAVSRIAPSQTAFWPRNAQYDFMVLSQWGDSTDTEHQIEWSDRFWEAMRPLAMDAAYVNDLGDEGEERIRASYGGNYPRLVSLKRKYDPDNLFRVNQNISPEPALHKKG